MTHPIRVSVYIDPSCPWTWITAGWLREVAPQRGLTLRWRSLSLVQRDGTDLPPSMPEDIRALASAARIQSHRLLRVFEALRAQSREDHIGGLYQAQRTPAQHQAALRCHLTLPASRDPCPRGSSGRYRC